MRSDDSWTVEMLILNQIDHDGLRHSISWDVDQLDEATAELDRLWAEEQSSD